MLRRRFTLFLCVHGTRYCTLVRRYGTLQYPGIFRVPITTTSTWYLVGTVSD